MRSFKIVSTYTRGALVHFYFRKESEIEIREWKTRIKITRRHYILGDYYTAYRRVRINIHIGKVDAALKISEEAADTLYIRTLGGTPWIDGDSHLYFCTGL